jgi:hypothetical protein
MAPFDTVRIANTVFRVPLPFIKNRLHQLVRQRFRTGWNSPCQFRRWLILGVRMWRKQLHPPRSSHASRNHRANPHPARRRQRSDALLSPHSWTHAGSENCRSNRCAHAHRTPTEMKPQPFGDARDSTHPSPPGFERIPSPTSGARNRVERRPRARFGPGSIRDDFRHPPAYGSRAPSAP